MNAEIIAVGTELLLGDIVNTNARYLSKELALLGFNVYFQTVVGDNAQRLAEIITLAKSRSGLLILCGGLGPTEDDLTKETLATVFRDRLELDSEELQKIQNFFAAQGKQMTKNNQKQAMCPVFGEKLKNDMGTAPGAMFFDKVSEVIAIALPGPPKELEWMFENEVKPKLTKYQNGCLLSKVLLIYGIGESELEDKIKSFVNMQNPTVALYAKDHEVALRITARADTSKEATVLISSTESRIRLVLKDNIYGVGQTSLEEVTVGILKEKLKTLATAESCTGGMLSQRITAVPGASDIFLSGICSYSNDAKSSLLGVKKKTIKKFGAVSSQVAGEMAILAAKNAKADIGIAITGIAGPTGGTPEKPVGLVYIAISYEKLVFIKKLEIFKGRGRNFVRTTATNQALDLLRRILCDIDLSRVRVFDKREQADFEGAVHAKKSNFTGKLILAVAAVVIAVCIGVGGYFLSHYIGNDFSFSSLAFWNNISLPIASAYPPFNGKPAQNSAGYEDAVRLHLSTLKKANSDTVAWLSVQDAAIEAPVVQTTDNTTYISYGFNKLPRSDGTLFFDARTLPLEDVSQNLIVYGSTSKASDGLGTLTGIKELERAKQISGFSLITEEKTDNYQTIAVLYSDTAEEQGFDVLNVGEFKTLRRYLEFIVGIKARSLFDFPVSTAEGDSFLSLVTDTNLNDTTKLIVVGKKLNDDEVIENLEITKASSPIMPKIYYLKNGGIMPDSEAAYKRYAVALGRFDTANGGLVGMLPQILPEYKEPDVGQDIDPNSSIISSSQSGGQSSKSSSSTVSSSKASSSVGSSSSVSSQSEQTPPPSTGATLTVRMNGVVVTDSALNILSQIAAQEMSSTWEPEAIKAQAVAAHTWILYQQANGDSAPSVSGRTAPGEKVTNAVSQVVNVVMTYAGKAAFTPYFSISAGNTNSSKDVWGGDFPYLQSVDSSIDTAATGYVGTVTLSSAQVAAMVLATTGIELSADPSTWFAVQDKTAGGYNGNMTIGGQTTYNGKRITGRAVREIILAGAKLRSAAFNIEIRGDNFIFTTYGYGHGAGLSQWGAQLYAKNHGYTYAQILTHYFSGITLS